MSGLLPRIGVIDAGARASNTPINVLFELTHRCNIKCFHCYVVPQRERDLDTAEVKRVLDQLAEAGTLFEIVRYARELHFAVRLFTNGTLIDEEAADRIAELHPVDVGISVYGACAETHEAVTCRQGSFEASVRALRLLKERGVYTHLKCVLMAENAGERAAIGDLADELGAHVQFDPQLTPRNDGDTSPLLHRMDDETASTIVHVDALEIEPDPLAAPCGAGRDLTTISPSGQVLPCVQWPKPFGSLRESSFEDIWNGPEASDVRSITLSRLGTCFNCADLRYCSPCPGLNFIEAGDATLPSSSVCQMARARMKGVDVWT